MFSKKATKIDEIFTVDLTLHNVELTVKFLSIFCVLLRKHELYLGVFFLKPIFKTLGKISTPEEAVIHKRLNMESDED